MATKTRRDAAPTRAAAKKSPKQPATSKGTARQVTTRQAKPTTKPGDITVGDVRISHPERVVFAQPHVTKGEVAAYYALIAPRLLAEIGGRPLSVLRCPDGTGAACFFQKHEGFGVGKHVARVPVRDRDGATSQYLVVNDALGLLELVQMNAIEFHPWGALAKDIERCDRLVFDLDPDAALPWKTVLAGALAVRKALADAGLASFARTSGGKGLHVVAPLKPAAPWDAARAFCEAVARTLAAANPEVFVATAGEKNRRGSIFIDWLRNGRGATSVAGYSLRARAGAPVAMPLAWAALARTTSGSQFSMADALAQRKRADPWVSLPSLRQSLPRA